MITNRLREIARDLEWAKRKRTSEGRALPDFIIIGAQKSGTTSLFHYLSWHPQLERSYRKEVHFFDGGLDPDDDNYVKGLDWYRANFPLRRKMSAGDRVFEASPFYLFHPLTAQRIAENLPDAKLIAIIRDPVERAVSHYFHECRKQRESLPIMEAFEAEEERLRPVIAARDFNSATFKNHSYKSRGCYREQLKRYFNLFPRENMLVMDSETFFTQPNDSLRRVYEFVRVDASVVFDNLKSRNPGRNKTDIDQGVYEYLESYFRSHNEDLYDLLDQRFDWR